MSKFLFIFSAIIFVTFFLACQNTRVTNQIHTVQGPINTSQLGLTLTHEHIMSNFGSDISETSKYDSLKLFNQVIPYLKQLKSYGVNSIFDCTTKYFGRNVDLLKMISDSTGLQIITNTGIYGAANDRYIPKFAYNAAINAISKVWIGEFENGIEGTKIKPGFIKLAFDNTTTPSKIDIKLFKAGIQTHLKTGLTLVVHTANNQEAVNVQTSLLNEYGVHPSA